MYISLNKYPADQIARLQNNAARLVIQKKEERKTKSRNTASQGTSLATRKIPLPVQDRDCYFEVFTSLFLFISLHLWTVSLSPIF